ncbi:transaminase [Liquorilactobacillus aquaticus DSM 21051]|uniref:Aminotransferase n=1 Tax=Liquorilactobacillus aquaticus DSM 21051 TaxID=1423725 RepID=A0A0R2D0G7_9LACO|nr:transaminase [Liquorilactobacillus aquaticus DSM 21051]
MKGTFFRNGAIIIEIAKFGVEEWLNKWEKEARFDISQSSVAALTLRELTALGGTTTAAFFEKLNSRKMDYGWIEGSPAFKNLVAELYQNVTAENILQTNGSTGANMLVLYALLHPGDHVVAPFPTYQQLYDIPRSLGAHVDFIHLEEDANWQLDVDRLAAIVTPKTKMICLNNANNPTGTLLERTALEQVVAVARAVDAYVVVDEVYSPLAGSSDFVSIADIYEKGIATNSLSKTYSLPGLRIGWVASPNDEIINLFRKYRDYTLISSGVLDNELAVLALSNREKILQRNREIVSENLEIVKHWIEKEPRVELVLPNYVPTSFIKLTIPEDDYSFCASLLKDTGVLLVPGSAFGVPQHARLGYCCNKEILKQGLSLLTRYLRKFDI